MAAWRRFTIALGRLFFRYRDFLFPAVLLGLVAVSEPRWPFQHRGWEIASNLLAVALGLAGLTLRSSVIGYAYIVRGGRNKRIYADGLVSEGFFAHCRNPMYVGNLLGLAGIAVLHHAPLTYLCFLLFAWAYWAIVVAEEAYLLDRFGDAYREYCRRVPRFRLRFAGLRESLAGMSFDWKKVLRKEYGTAFSTVMGYSLLWLWDDYRRLGSEQIETQVTIVTTLGVVATIGWALVRVLKKTGRLGWG